MKKKISMFVINVVFVGLIAIIWTSLALTYILPTAENVTHDTAISQPDTLSFEAEMAIVDSIIGIQKGVSYKESYMIPHGEINTNLDIQQTLIRYPNGMPKIMVRWTVITEKPVRFVMDEDFLNFYSDNGHLIAEGYRYNDKSSYKWECVAWVIEPIRNGEKSVIQFQFSNPNVCRNITLH